MRMKAFKSHGMNRVMVRALTHALRDNHKGGRSTYSKSYNTNNSADANAGCLAVILMVVFFIIVVAVCN
jgi:hypothetical protein